MTHPVCVEEEGPDEGWTVPAVVIDGIEDVEEGRTGDGDALDGAPDL